MALNGAAMAAGLLPGMTLAHARAVLPRLTVAGADPASDQRVLAMLADWCGRYTPWTAVDSNADYRGPSGGGAGLWLDISGSAHLFGGEQKMLADLLGRLLALGFAGRAAVADSAGAAWAMARFAEPAIAVVAPQTAETALAPLPVAGLRLPASLLDALDEVGLRRIGELASLSRAALASRFGTLVLNRLDQALGLLDEPLSPRRPVPAMAARLAFADPIGRADDIARASRHLLEDLCAKLELTQLGARRLELAAYRTDGTTARVAIGTSRPVRDPRHLERLLREKLAGIDAGFGIEVMILAATVADPLAPAQAPMAFGDMPLADDVARLIDRLGNRFGADHVVRLKERASHIPERSCVEVSALADGPGDRHTDRLAMAAGGDQRSRQPRPLHLLPSPEPIEVIAPIPDGPPALFRWRRLQHRVALAEGPERIAPEWWLTDDGCAADNPARTRDYYRVEDSEGRRFWLYREGLYLAGITPRWYLHGLLP
jgi:protein ImuB